MKHMNRRILAVALAAVMLLGLLPTASALVGDGPEQTPVTEVTEPAEETPAQPEETPAEAEPQADRGSEVSTQADSAITTWAQLQAALTAGGDITLTADITADVDGGDTRLLVPAGVTVTLDLNGHTIDRGLKDKTPIYFGNVLTVGGTLTVKDSSEGETGKITGGSCIGRANGGSQAYGDEIVEGSGVSVVPGGSFTFTGGSITGNTTCTSANSGRAMQGTYGGGVGVVGGGTFVMTGGRITENVGRWAGGVAVITWTQEKEDSDRPVKARLLGGEITNNSLNGFYDNSTLYAGGVTLQNSSGYRDYFELTLGGSIVIQNNTQANGTVYNMAGYENFNDGSVPFPPFTLSTDTPLTADAKIGFTVGRDTTVDANGYSFATGDTAYRCLKNITCDNVGTNYIIGLKKDSNGNYIKNELFLATADSTVVTVPSAWQQLTWACEDGGDITLTEDAVAADGDSVLVVPAGKTVTVDLNGHKIDRNLAGVAAIKGGNVITVNGTLTVTDTSADKAGQITGGNNSGTSDDGSDLSGGIYVAGTGNLTLEAGSITGNKSSTSCGGVYVDDNATFNMTGGSITGNTVPNYGGGVLVKGGTFTMTGGSITGNTASIAGGVWVYTDGTFTMIGGSITGNTAAEYRGGGVDVVSGNFTMTGGSITGNTATNYGCGVSYMNGTFTVGGSAVIENNTLADGTTASNVYLYTGKSLTLSAGTPLTEGAKIGISAKDAVTADGVKIAASADGSAAKYSRNFFLDDAAAEYIIGVKKDDSNTVFVAPKGSDTVFVPWNVDIKLGDHMQLADGSGALTQKLVVGEMNKIVLRADDGYCFPDNYAGFATAARALNDSGLTVTPNEDGSQITISGTPTGDLNLTLAAAEEAPPKFTDGNGNTLNPADYVKGETTNENGDIFDGWVDKDGNKLDSLDNAKPGVTYTPSWKTPDPKFTDGNGNTLNPADYVKGETVNDRGYTFAGWFDESGNELDRLDNAVPGKSYAPKWTKNGKTVRTEPLDINDTAADAPWKSGCKQNGTLWTNEAEGWSWDEASKTLTLSGATLDVEKDSALPDLDGFAAIILPDGATVITAKGTKNTVINRSRLETGMGPMGGIGIFGEGTLTVAGDGELSVTGGAYGVITDGDLTVSGPLSATATDTEGNVYAILAGTPESPAKIIISPSLRLRVPEGGKLVTGFHGQYIAGSDGETSALRVVIDRIPADEPADNTGAVKTGDAGVTLYIGLASAALLATGAAVLFANRKRREE